MHLSDLQTKDVVNTFKQIKRIGEDVILVDIMI